MAGSCSGGRTVSGVALARPQRQPSGVLLDLPDHRAADDDFGYVLRHGRECGVRVLATTGDTSVERSAVVDSFDSRIVFALDDEEVAVRLLGRPWALTLAEPGRRWFDSAGAKRWSCVACD